MKNTLVLALAVNLAGAVAFAQHGRGMGHGSAGAAPAMGQGAGKGQGGGATGQAGHMGAQHNPATFVTDHPQLQTRLQSLLPTGMTAQQAAEGFKNTGQFIAALHVSKNLGIPFADLKAKMTGPHAESLGKAIEDLKPAISKAEAKTAVKEAEHESKQDIEASEKKTAVKEAERASKQDVEASEKK